MSQDKKVDPLVEKAKKLVPLVDEILDEAVVSLGILRLSQGEILKNFGDLISQLENSAHDIYNRYEALAFKELISLVKAGKQTLSDSEIESLVFKAKRLEFQAGQMRKSRGGSSLHKIVQKLLNLAGVSCETPHKETKEVLRRIDLVAPDADTAKDTPDKAIFLAVKRTLRERWKQVVPEHMKGARLYLVTINGHCSEQKAKEIKETGMVAYVPEHLKNQKHLKDKHWIRPLSELPKDVGRYT